MGGCLLAPVLGVLLRQQSASQWPLQQKVEWGAGWQVSWGPGDRLRAVSCRSLEPLPRPPTGWAQALKQQNLSPIPVSYPRLSHLMVEAFSMDGGWWNPQQQECMDTAIKITASTSLSLPIQVPKIGTVEMGYLLIGGGQRSGWGCKDIGHCDFRSTSVVGAILKEGQLWAGNEPDWYLLQHILLLLLCKWFSPV